MLDTWAFYSAIVSWFCNLVLVNSSYILSHGGDSLTTFVLFLNLFFNCYAIVKNKIAFKHIYSFATRLLQIHLCYVYFFAGIGKVLGKDWFDGNSIFHALLLESSNIMSYETAIEYSFLFVILGWGTLIIEIFYPVFIWHKSTRKYILWVIVSLHIGIIFFMKLYFFGLIMILLNLIAWRNPYLGGERIKKIILKT